MIKLPVVLILRLDILSLILLLGKDYGILRAILIKIYVF